MKNLVYKIVASTHWQQSQAAGAFAGSVDDLRDGFVHLSAQSQVAETLQKHFAEANDLLLIAFDPAEFGEKLRWETSRAGAEFPHLYAELPVSAARQIYHLQRNDRGEFQLPWDAA
jgi:uncharacterized protein (DUF952 family)